MTLVAQEQPTLVGLSEQSLGTPLSEVTFVVVDLETTGGSPRECGITEVGAVKVRGGQVLGEFATLVNPGQPIPPFIQRLTGISDADVAQAPRIGSVLPSFLEFSAGTVLVAHNAQFDISFLKSAAQQCSLPWPGHQVMDTVHLARQIVPRGEVRNHKLGTLAAHFGAATTPNHRALADAQATVDVLHALIARVGSLGVSTLEELSAYSSRVSTQQRRRRWLADDLPHQPGVYIFEDEAGSPLYVGTSHDIRARVLQYFTASEGRSRMASMVHRAAKVTPIVCPTVLEAQVRELRLIATHKPHYNRRSRNPGRAVWVKITQEAYPRLSVVREQRDDGATYAGPFTSRSKAQSAIAALTAATGMRECTRALPLTPRDDASACALADLGSCPAPCIGGISAEDYGTSVEQVRGALVGTAVPVVRALHDRLHELAAAERFESAATVRDDGDALVNALGRGQQVSGLTRIEELIAARRSPRGGWELVCIRHGRLVGSTHAPSGADPMPYVRALQETSEVVSPGPGSTGAASFGETWLVHRWLDQEGVRLVELSDPWCLPVDSAPRFAREFALDSPR